MIAGAGFALMAVARLGGKPYWNVRNRDCVCPFCAGYYRILDKATDSFDVLRMSGLLDGSAKVIL